MHAHFAVFLSAKRTTNSRLCSRRLLSQIRQSEILLVGVTDPAAAPSSRWTPRDERGSGLGVVVWCGRGFSASQERQFKVSNFNPAGIGEM